MEQEYVRQHWYLEDSGYAHPLKFWSLCGRGIRFKNLAASRNKVTCKICKKKLEAL